MFALLSRAWLGRQPHNRLLTSVLKVSTSRASRRSAAAAVPALCVIWLCRQLCCRQFAHCAEHETHCFAAVAPTVQPAHLRVLLLRSCLALLLTCRHPETPWVFLMGIIHVDSTVGFGVYGTVVPALSHLTEQHLQQLPAAVHKAFPRAESIALAGRLPSLMTAAGEVS